MSLNGDQIDIKSTSNLIDVRNVTVGDGIEASADLGAIQIDVDVDVDENKDSFKIIYTNSSSDLTSTDIPSLKFTLSDLDWIGEPDRYITGVNSTGEIVRSVDYGTDRIRVKVPYIEDMNGDSSLTYSFDITTECFLSGTNILTERGEIPVEELNIGDLVQTAEGELKSIKWIGRQTIEPNKVANPVRSYPVQIRAGALGDNIPSRDLYTSPDHSLFIDGLLINAGALVNGISVISTEPVATFVYYHIELENHSLLLAEGTPTESYLPQKENRDEYDNSAEYEQLYPHASNLMLWPLDYPRISSKNKVPRFISQKLMNIAVELYGEGASEIA